MSGSLTAQSIRLRYWKSEHDEQSCEDAFGVDTSRGLFAVADGVGTTLFASIWASLLVDQFLDTPLLSNDSFELEWWLRQAQELYPQRLPPIDSLAWNAVQKNFRQPSYSTLATLRVTHLAPDAAWATLLAIGDSCILIKDTQTQHLHSFPLHQVSDFAQAPLCLPSKPASFQRRFHQCFYKKVFLKPGDQVFLATDAVVRWILSAANGRFSTSLEAFDAIAAQNQFSWPAFIDECRLRHEMQDDDCTLLNILIGVSTSHEDEPLGFTDSHSQTIREHRVLDYQQAVQDDQKDLMAITYGDGRDLAMQGILLPSEQVQLLHAVADALHEVLSVLRREVNNPDAAAKISPTWQRYADLLFTEPCASQLRLTLQRVGVPLTPLETFSQHALLHEDRFGE